MAAFGRRGAVRRFLSAFSIAKTPAFVKNELFLYDFAQILQFRYCFFLTKKL